MKPNNDCAAICGLFCGTCSQYPVFCEGCLSTKCNCDCMNGFRDCAKNNSVTRCYECKNFPCPKLEDFSKKHFQNGICHHSQVITDLQSMKKLGVDAWVEKQTLENTCPKCGELIYWYEKKTHKCKN